MQTRSFSNNSTRYNYFFLLVIKALYDIVGSLSVNSWFRTWDVYFLLENLKLKNSHSLFIIPFQHVFKLEQEEYLKEGIEWKMIDFYDNQVDTSYSWPCLFETYWPRGKISFK